MTGFTTAKPHSSEEIKRRSQMRYSGYMARHGVDSIQIRHISQPVEIKFKNKSLVVTNTAKVNACEIKKLDYLIVYRGFKGDIVDLANKLRPDSVILSVDIHHALHHRYLTELRDAGIPSRSLKDAPVIVR